MIRNMWKHFKLINKHRWIVFKLCVKAGIPWRGLVHDLSKYGPTEFLESAKYYAGNRSPVQVCREKRQYSMAWLHHKGKNKHHEEYWYDWNSPIKAPIVPYRYAAEMLCDCISAGIVYKGSEWTKEYPLYYWENKKNHNLFNPKMLNFFEEIFKEIKEKDIKDTINSKNLKEKYNKYCK